MKTLKFMLAAATAIGLASATQADQYNTTGFEKLSVGDPVTTGVKDNSADDSYFYYAGAVAEDNESVIAAGTPDIARPRGAASVDATRNNILQVSTGTDPLMRTYKTTTMQGGVLKPQAASEITSDIYVDTLVQFTVTPYTDTVTPGQDDKLMIYLKESVGTNEFGEITSASTNLVVIGGYMVDDATFEPKEYKITGVNIEPNTWHRLTVKVIANYGALDGYHHPAFLIYLDGVSDPCVLDDLAIAEAETDTGYVAPFDDDSLTLTELDEKNLVFSLKCDSQTAATLQGVGFAGEGKVDDIVFSTLDPFATVFDFTFAFDPQKVSAVTYTVGGASKDQAGVYEVEANTEVVITSITYANGWQAGSTNVVNMTPGLVEGLYTVTGAGASITIVPAEAPSGEELEPGEQSSTTYASQAAAEAALANVTIAASDAVANELDPTALAAYLAKFEKRVVETGSGEYKVEVGLKAAAEADLQDEVDADAAEVIEDLDTATVTLTTTPGFYYSFEYGTTLDNMAEVGTRTLATGSTLQLTRPTTANATSGFYKVLVNIAPAVVTP